MGKNHLLDLTCSGCGVIVDDPTDLRGGRCDICAGAEDKLGGRDRRGDAGLARMYAEDRRQWEVYGIDAGLARDDEKQRRGNHG